MAYIKIENCTECNEFKEDQDYTADSFEHCTSGFCKKEKRYLFRYKDWYEKYPLLPDWCPKRKNSKKPK